MTEADRVALFRNARRDPSLVVVEGLHALKHALRFGAEVVEALSPAPPRALDLASTLAPDIVPALTAQLRACPIEVFEAAAPQPPTTGVIALAKRPLVRPDQAFARLDRPLVVLHDPRHQGNLGAVVRVAAALDAAGVMIHGTADPFAPAAVRGAAGLQFALPCFRLAQLDFTNRSVIAFADNGSDIDAINFAAPTALLFGSERRGLPSPQRQAADKVATIPMRAGVSSLNLATAVAIGLARATAR